MSAYSTAFIFSMANKLLILLRHAKSDWSNAADSDFERPLSARGRDDAPRMGQWLVETGNVPEVIVGSPSARTTETIELVCAELGHDSARVIYDERLYHGMPEQIHEMATAQFEHFGRVLVVAHNPGMELALRAYCPTAEPFADGKLMPTCAVAVIELDDPDQPAHGNLRVLMRPSML